METKVKGHYTRRGWKKTWIPAHEMHVNPEIHERHEHRLREEIRELEQMQHAAHEHSNRVKV